MTPDSPWRVGLAAFALGAAFLFVLILVFPVTP